MLFSASLRYFSVHANTNLLSTSFYLQIQSSKFTNLLLNGALENFEKSTTFISLLSKQAGWLFGRCIALG